MVVVLPVLKLKIQELELIAIRDQGAWSIKQLMAIINPSTAINKDFNTFACIKALKSVVTCS